ncbi:RuBisCO accumulation factor 1 [Tumidithrix helvetica PCC 7403]|uniref:RuBisCO accumulation factor 1 n=1 Tax=Tumidithrix helvetica TaxID=3457545 RepID=UPI003C9C4B6C
MTDNTQTPEAEAERLFEMLRRKEGTWVQWGQACQQLQKMGESSLAIFENTGFEPIQQNQIMVGAQVYTGLVSGDAPAALLTHFERKGSDILYELRILSLVDRIAVAELALAKELDCIEVKDIAKAVKDISTMANLPEGFTRHPGDAVAFQVWKALQAKQDSQEKARLIARGLKFANSNAARVAIERSLTDMIAPTTARSPRLPVFRYDEEHMLPRVLPVAGELPLAIAAYKAVPMADEWPPFGMVKSAKESTWVAIPGWQAIVDIQDGVVILADTNTLKQVSGQELVSNVPSQPEQVLVICDRAQREWDDNSYFVVEQDKQVKIQWFDAAPEIKLLGRVVLVLRQMKIFDTAAAQETWQIDE